MRKVTPTSSILISNKRHAVATMVHLARLGKSSGSTNRALPTFFNSSAINPRARACRSFRLFFFLLRLFLRSSSCSNSKSSKLIAKAM